MDSRLLVFALVACAALGEPVRNDLLVTSRPVYVRLERQEETTNSTKSVEGNQEGILLGADFLSLFDEIWRIKRLSLTALAANEEQARRQLNGAATSPATTTVADNLNSDEPPDESPPPPPPQHNLLSMVVHPKPLKLLQRQQATAQANVKQHGATLINQLSVWLQQLNSRISQAMQLVLAKPSVNIGANVVDNEQTQNEEDPLSVRRRRQTQELAPTDTTCVRLNQEQTNECRFAELQVGTVMNTSFPATPAAIEDNCRHVTFLLSSCWPEQLQLVRSAIQSGSWNESLLRASSFQLPTLEPDQTTSCSLKPQLPDPLLDRITWMWLNFCMDKKFRRDYLDHLRCLSFWSQDRAHAVCHDQWRVIQNGPGNALAHSTLGASKRNPGASQRKSSLQFPQLEPTGEMTLTTADYSSPANVTTTTTTAASIGTANGRHVTQEPHLETKTLCCMFDLFLRCVHRQALRDCGRSGAQLVVNFMARIGTDDMKWVCNADNLTGGPKTRPPAQGEKRRISNNSTTSAAAVVAAAAAAASAESLSPSPFIERFYCNDPKISHALRAQTSHISAEDLNRFPGNDHHHHQRNRPNQGGRTNTRGPQQSSNNPLQDLDDAEMALKDSASSLNHHQHHLLLIILLLATSIAQHL